MASQIYQAAEYITVTNNFSPDADYRPWVDAILSCTQESTYIYGRKMELIAYNNRWGTLNGSEPADLANVHTVFRYLSRTYSGTERAIHAITTTYRFHHPGFFDLEVLKTGKIVHGRAWPVLGDGTLMGVVISGWIDGPTLSKKQDGICVQSRSKTTHDHFLL
jgi:hypothetical protein